MSRIEFPPIASVSEWLANVQDAMAPGSYVNLTVRDDIRKIVWLDNERKMLSGITRYGQMRAPLAESTLKNKKRGPGPSLVPRGRMSRYITQFVAEWTRDGAKFILTAHYRWFVSKSGFPIPLAHERGVPKHNLPARPVMGITPEGMREIAARLKRLADHIAKGVKFGQ